MKPKKTQRKPAPPPVRGKKPRKPSKFPKARPVKATYDASLPDIDGDHWLWADALNANAANSRDVRKTLRERAQYEADNNGYCGGLVDRLANDLVGTGPRPQLRIPGASRQVTREIEVQFVAWARRVSLPQKLRLLDQGATIRGESFAILATNPALPPTGVQLDLRLYETDQVETPYVDYGDPLQFDGGTLDDFGNVTTWHFLKAHPGSDVWGFSQLEKEDVPAGRVLHWYKPRRAGQIRGVPEILSSLTLYAYLRRYTLATLGAAETAASIAGILKTEHVNPDASEDPGADGITAMDKIPIPRNTLLTAPAGWDIHQLKAEQPITQFGAFRSDILTEAGSAVGAPRNVSTNSSAEYNYSSGRLDRGIYEGGIRVRRADLRGPVLDPVLRAWVAEARLVGIVPADAPPVEAWSWDWFYDAFPSVDPLKDAQRVEIGLRSGFNSFAEVCAERGLDWEEHLEQRGVELERANELGLTALMTLAGQSTGGVQPTDEQGNPLPDDGTGQKGAAAAGGVQNTALNGAQVTSLLLIADSVVAKRYPADAAENIIRAAFPLMPAALVKSFVGSLAKHEPPAPPPEQSTSAEAAPVQPAEATAQAA